MMKLINIFKVNNMIVNRNFAKVVSALFFLEFSFLLAFGIIHFFPDYSFMKTHLFRIIAFIVIAVLSSFFYGYISEDYETINGEDKGNFLIKGEIEYNRLIPIVIVFLILIVLIVNLFIP